MYRDYENPYTVEKLLAKAKEELKREPDNIDLYIEVQELEDRLNFAWQDEEYDLEY